MQLLRHPGVPRRLPLPAARRRARRGGLAGRPRRPASCCWSARTPPPTARTWATCGCSRRCCPTLAAVPGIARVRVSYLQPAEVRPGLVEVMTSTPAWRPYFDLSFQHASGRVLRRDAPVRRHRAVLRADRPDQARVPRRRASGPTSSSASPARPPATWPSLSCSCRGPGWTRSASSATPTRTAPRPPRCPGTLDPATRSPAGSSELSDLAEELMAQRAADRVGETVEVLIEEDSADGRYEGRAAHQAPEVDGATTSRCARRPLGRRVTWSRAAGRRGRRASDLVADAVGPRRLVSRHRRRRPWPAGRRRRRPRRPPGRAWSTSPTR